MSVLHLLWIVPLSASLGYITCALMTVSSRADERTEKEEK